MPLVSVITAAYNAELYIAETIRSVLNQTFCDWEYIIVDDGSTDETGKVVEPYLDRVMYVRQENRGQAAARNRAFSLASGKYIAILDSDDLWEPDKLRQQVEVLERDPGIGLVYTGVKMIDEKGNILERLYPAIDISQAPLHYLLTSGNPICYSSVLFNRRFLDQDALQDETIRHVDELLTLMKVALRASRFGYIREQLTYYRLHSQSLAQSERVRDYRDGALRALQKFYRLPDVPPSYRKLRRKSFGRVYYLVAQRSIDRRTDLVDAAQDLVLATLYRPEFLPLVIKQFAEILYRLATGHSKASS